MKAQWVQLLLVAVLVLGFVAPVVGEPPSRTTASGSQLTANQSSTAIVNSAPTQSGNETNDTSVTVGVGKQLSTIIAVTETDVQTAFGEAAFTFRIRGGSANGSDDPTERANVLADRGTDLREQAVSITADYERLRGSSQNGTISRSAYAFRLAALNARATNTLASIDTFRRRSGNVSEAALRAAGLNESALSDAETQLDAVTGSGSSAILARFTGQMDGEIELETGDGVSIEVESEDGERTREIERKRDAERGFDVSQSDALATARAALSNQSNSWTLQHASIDEDDGYYQFEFTVSNATRRGEAEVRVDGASGTVFDLEEETEPRDGDDTDEDLGLVVASGTPEPDATVTLEARSAGNPAGNVTVSINDRQVGTTGQDGRLQVRLPAGDADVEAERGDQDADLEFEFEAADDEGDDEEVPLTAATVDATLDDGTVTLTVTANGAGVAGAVVEANGDEVGSTDDSGTLTFGFDPSEHEELDVEIETDDDETERVYALSDGQLVRDSDEE